MRYFFNHFDLYTDKIFNLYANVRFDLKRKEPISYHTDLKSFNGSIQSHLPDATLGYQDNITASDVFDIIKEYLETSPNLCGSSIIIAAKRYPNEVERLDDLISELRRNRVFVYIVAIDTLNGGSNLQSLYEISTKSNGLCTISNDTYFSNSVSWIQQFALHYPYQLKSENVVVSGTGSVTIPLETTRKSQDLLTMFTFLNHKYDHSVQHLNATLSDSNGTILLAYSMLPGKNYGRQTDYVYSSLKCSNAYLLTINYTYLPGRQEVMDIRINTISYDNGYWPPYDN